MKKFLFEFYGGKGHTDMEKDEMMEVMNQWKAWFATFADKLVDGGGPLADGGMAVTEKGADVIPADMWPTKGYTVINAKDMDEATEIASSCPSVVNKEKDATVRVFEVMSM